MKELIISPIYNDKGIVIGQEYHGELIRCGECRYNNTISGYKGESKWCSILERMVKEEDYCSWAERKEE